MGLPPW
ncbi:hypothetical protein A2U01_0047934, partial [Trifolium medium]|nr:hypothetical protein [Trifolium medium]